MLVVRRESMPSGKITRLNTLAKWVVGELLRYFRRSGYVRYQVRERLLREGYNGYKKGDELRLGAVC
jgi:hypothetical protein